MAFEPLDVDRHTPLSGDELGQVDGKTIGVVEGESVEPGYPSLPACGNPVEDLQSPLDGALEGLFLGRDNPLDHRAVLDEFGEAIAEALYRRLHQIGK